MCLSTHYVWSDADEWDGRRYDCTFPARVNEIILQTTGTSSFLSAGASLQDTRAEGF